MAGGVAAGVVGGGAGGGTKLTGFRAELAFLLQCHQLIRNESSPSPFLLHVWMRVCVYMHVSLCPWLFCVCVWGGGGAGLV